MSNKVRIGGDSDLVRRATDAERRAVGASADVTMMRRRINTFYLAISEVSFPEDAPVWASEWVQWLQTGAVAPVEDTTEEVLVEETGLSAQEVADEAGIVVERVTTEEATEEAADEVVSEDEADAAAAQADLAAPAIPTA